MGNDLLISCDGVPQRLKALLDDLLREEEYQAMHTHLAQCAKCKEYVRSVDSLSNQLKELGEVNVPQDLASTIHFRVQHPPEKPASTRSHRSRTPVIVGSLVLIFLGAAVLFGAPYFKAQGPPHDPAQAPMAPKIMVEIVRPGDREAALVLKQLEALADALGTSPSPEKVPETIVPQPLSSGKGTSPVSRGVPPVVLEPVHWHFPYAAEGERLRLLNTLRILGVEQDYEVSDLWVFSASQWQLQRLGEEMRLIAQQAAAEADFNFLEKPLPDRQARVSIYFDRGETGWLGALHWHLRLSPSGRAKLYGGIRELGIVLDYESAELLVLSVPREELATFIDRIKAIEGVTVDFGSSDLTQGRSAAGAVRVSIFIGER